MTDLARRSFGTGRLTVRDDADAGADEWTVEGIVVPWDDTIVLPWGERERWQRGALDGAQDALLYAEHNHLAGASPIGRVIATEARDAGQWIKARISRTAAGADVHQLLTDGVYNRFSIGFEPVTVRYEDDDAGTVSVIEKARMREASVVGFPAYAAAEVQGVRHNTSERPAGRATTEREATMTEQDTTTRTAGASAQQPAAPDGDELRAELTDLTRRMAVVEQNRATVGHPGHALPYRSLGEWLRGLADRSSIEHAAEVQAAYAEASDQLDTRATDTGTAGSTVVPTWVDRDIRLVNKGRKVLNLFSKQPLPPEGLTIDYPKLESTTGDVAKQSAEGADLPLLSIKIGSASASVATYGGAATVTRQVIERSSVAYLNKLLDYMKISYGKQTNAAVRAALTGWTGVTVGEDISATNTEASAWIDAIVSGVESIEENSVGLSAEFLLVPFSTFKIITAIEDSTGRPIFDHRNDGSNTIGDVNVRGLSATIEGVPVIPVPKLGGQKAYLCSGDALTVLESAGAPFDLTQDQILNLTKDFALYGYMALTKNDPAGVVAITTEPAV